MRDVRGRWLVPRWLAGGSLVCGLVLSAWSPVLAASTAAAPIVGGTLTTDFPAVGGTYDADQHHRIAELRKS